MLGVLANYMNPDAGPLAVVLDTGPAHSTLDLHADNSFTYAPMAGLRGVDSFTSHASDGAADSNIATVQIAVAGSRIFLPVKWRSF